MSEFSHVVRPDPDPERPPAGVEEHPPGELIRRHRHDYAQLIYVSTGVLAISTDRGAWVGSRDRAVWIPAGTWHQHRAYGATSVHTVGFAAGDAVRPGGSPTVIAVDGLLRELLLAYTEPGLPAAEAGNIRAVLRDRLSRARLRPLTLPAARDPRLSRACDLVTADLRRPRTLGWLASQAGAGERTLNRLYRAEFGQTYPQWRTTVRVFHAMIALAEGATVTETAHACGWATTSAFIDTFARTMGQTPGTYRAAAPPSGPGHRRSSRRRPAAGRR
jgi:AraC-like DNA-binding protein